MLSLKERLCLVKNQIGWIAYKNIWNDLTRNVQLTILDFFFLNYCCSIGSRYAYMHVLFSVAWMDFETNYQSLIHVDVICTGTIIENRHGRCIR